MGGGAGAGSTIFCGVGATGAFGAAVRDFFATVFGAETGVRAEMRGAEVTAAGLRAAPRAAVFDFLPVGAGAVAFLALFPDAALLCRSFGDFAGFFTEAADAFRPDVERTGATARALAAALGFVTALFFEEAPLATPDFGGLAAFSLPAFLEAPSEARRTAAFAFAFDDLPATGFCAGLPGFLVTRFVAIRGHPRLWSNAGLL